MKITTTTNKSAKTSRSNKHTLDLTFKTTKRKGKSKQTDNRALKPTQLIKTANKWSDENRRTQITVSDSERRQTRDQTAPKHNRILFSDERIPSAK